MEQDKLTGLVAKLREAVIGAERHRGQPAPAGRRRRRAARMA
jgi:hypothetical protein